MTASSQALYERLVFQNLTYNRETHCCNQHPIPVLLIMTSNAPDATYLNLLDGYRQTLTHFVGPTDLLIDGDTLQLKDYSRLAWEWSMFDPEAKQLRRETVFLQERKSIRHERSAFPETKRVKPQVLHYPVKPMRHKAF